MDFKPKVIPGVAAAMVFSMAHEAVPRFHEPGGCSVMIGMTVCSAEEEFIEPRNVHTPHSEYETEIPSAFRWIASGQVSATSTGPSHSEWLSAGESTFRR